LPETSASAAFLDLLRCPASGQTLTLAGDTLISAGAQHRYRLLDGRIPAFAEQPATAEARKQQAHYDRIAAAYRSNLQYPHTIE
jgi:hypothetical protein